VTSTDSSTHPLPKPIRSFVRRQGRITAAQQRALTLWWERYGVTPVDGPLDLDTLFGRSAPRVLEIGFGNGETLAAMALAQPELDFLGIEVHRPGVGRLLRRAAELHLTNLKLLCQDAVPVLEQHLAAASLARVQIFFPDPWPKPRHHKRRLIQPAFVALLTDRLQPGGLLQLATDWEEYARQMLAVLTTAPALVNTVADGFAPRPDDRPLTRFEWRGQQQGHQVYDLVFRRR
jgi:tRNA (guanine-N7-)-methyltransferase